MHANTDHDEKVIRENYRGEAWLGLESMHRPVEKGRKAPMLFDQDGNLQVQGTFTGENRAPGYRSR